MTGNILVMDLSFLGFNSLETNVGSRRVACTFSSLEALAGILKNSLRISLFSFSVLSHQTGCGSGRVSERAWCLYQPNTEWWGNRWSFSSTLLSRLTSYASSLLVIEEHWWSSLKCGIDEVHIPIVQGRGLPHWQQLISPEILDEEVNVDTDLGVNQTGCSFET